MKTIVVLSDTHGRDLDAILPLIEENDYVVFCGDGKAQREFLERKFPSKAICVGGNCDRSREEKTVEIEKTRFFITHGHEYDVKTGLESLVFKAEEVGADVVFFGHTHRPVNERINGILAFNAGSWGYDSTYGYVVVEGKKVFAKIVSKA